jgi:hypothetical protein
MVLVWCNEGGGAHQLGWSRLATIESVGPASARHADMALQRRRLNATTGPL